MSSDSFRDGQELTRALRDELKDVRQDVDAIVRREVERAGLDPLRVQALVREAVARELDARTPWTLARLPWLGPAIAAGVGLALGLSLFAVFSVRSVRTAAADAVALAAADTPAAAAPPSEEVSPPVPDDPLARAARYDSLFAAQAPELDPLIGRVEAVTSDAQVQAAVAAWKLGRMSPELRDRLHAALVQAILQTEVDPTLAIDGGILREPCRGASCGAMLRLWRERGPEFGLPPFSATAAADPSAVRTAERLLVLSRLEGGEG